PVREDAADELHHVGLQPLGLALGEAHHARVEDDHAALFARRSADPRIVFLDDDRALTARRRLARARGRARATADRERPDDHPEDAHRRGAYRIIAISGAAMKDVASARHGLRAAGRA